MTGPFAEKLWASTSVAGHQGRFQVEDEACRELLSNLKECLSSLDPGTIRHMPNCRSPTGRTPVIVAAAACNLGALEALLNVGYSTDDTEQNGLTALSFAARDGDEKIVAQLLKSGANPSIHDYFGAAPLHKAVSFGHPGVLQKMLQIKGVDVNLKTIPVRDNYPVEFQATSLHETPLHLAVSSTRAIMENPQKRYQSLDLLLATGADPNICDVNGDTPLHTASKMRDLQAIARLRRAGASDSIQNKAGFTPRMLLDELSLPRSIIPGVHSLQRKLALHSPLWLLPALEFILPGYH